MWGGRDGAAVGIAMVMEDIWRRRTNAIASRRRTRCASRSRAGNSGSSRRLGYSCIFTGQSTEIRAGKCGLRWREPYLTVSKGLTETSRVFDCLACTIFEQLSARRRGGGAPNLWQEFSGGGRLPARGWDAVVPAFGRVPNLAGQAGQALRGDRRPAVSPGAAAVGGRGPR